MSGFRQSNKTMLRLASILLLSFYSLTALGMNKVNISFWQVIAEVQGQKRLSLEKTETILNQKLTEETEQSNEYFQMYKGKSIQLAEGLVIATIDLRLPRAPTRNDGLLALNLEGECITLPQVKQQFPVLKITGTPRGRSLEDSTTYTANTPWGEVDFGFQEKRPDCLGYVIFHPTE